MNIGAALISATNYPIPANQIEKIAIGRGLTIGDTYNGTVAESEAYQLAEADVFLFMYSAVDIGEQEIRMSVGDREDFLNKANMIYGLYDDPKFTGVRYGFIGDTYNG